MNSPTELRELARWYTAAAANASDPRIKAAMVERARELSHEAEQLSARRIPAVVLAVAS